MTVNRLSAGGNFQSYDWLSADLCNPLQAVASVIPRKSGSSALTFLQHCFQTLQPPAITFDRLP